MSNSPLQCPNCHSTEIRKRGKQTGKQRYVCLNALCPHPWFQSAYHQARTPAERSRAYRASEAKKRKKRRRKAYHTSESTEWETPQWFFDKLDAEFHFTLDPCATCKNAKCPRFYTIDDDGLAQDWAGEVVWMNPPYGRTIGAWMRKAYESSLDGALVVCLVPVRTDTKWWRGYARHGDIDFIPGRLKFGDGKTPAPFPSALVIFHPAVAQEVVA